MAIITVHSYETEAKRSEVAARSRKRKCPLFLVFKLSSKMELALIAVDQSSCASDLSAKKPQ